MFKKFELFISFAGQKQDIDTKAGGIK